MKYLFAILVIIGIYSCDHQQQKFIPIESSEELTKKQIDSILTKFDFNYETPILIDSTDQIVIPISTELLERKGSYSSSPYNSDDFPRYWNILFYNKSTGENRLLTKEKTRISNFYVNREDPEDESIKTKIFYELTQLDYNKDGKLNRKDPEFLFASNLNGTELVQVSPKKEDLQRFSILPYSTQIILRTLRDTNQDSIFNDEDDSILYKAELNKNDWTLSEIIDSTKRNDIENLYFKQWLTKEKLK